MEVKYTQERPELSTVQDELSELPLGGFSVRATGDDAYIIRARFLTEDERQAILNTLSSGGDVVTEERFNSIGPTIGAELKSKAIVALIIVVVAIIFFIAYVFRGVSKPVSSWRYGFVAIVALVHDVLIAVGVFAILGQFGGVEIDILFVMAQLAILGFSVNDTIVVFDRVRENLKLNQDNNNHEPFDDTVGKSLEQTFARSINTSITTLLVLVALFIFGGDSTRTFALALMIGVVAGTYSSIFLASPLLVEIGKRQQVVKSK